jgi:hypothetical protein
MRAGPDGYGQESHLQRVLTRRRLTRCGMTQ